MLFAICVYREYLEKCLKDVGDERLSLIVRVIKMAFKRFAQNNRTHCSINATESIWARKTNVGSNVPISV